EKPSEKRVREQAEAVRRARKLARKRAQREGLLPGKAAGAKPGAKAGGRPGGPARAGAGGPPRSGGLGAPRSKHRKASAVCALPGEARVGLSLRAKASARRPIAGPHRVPDRRRYRCRYGRHWGRWRAFWAHWPGETAPGPSPPG